MACNPLDLWRELQPGAVTVSSNQRHGRRHAVPPPGSPAPQPAGQMPQMPYNGTGRIPLPRIMRPTQEAAVDWMALLVIVVVVVLLALAGRGGG